MVSQPYIQLKFGGLWRDLILKSRREWILEKNYETSYHWIGRNKEAFFTTYRTHNFMGSVNLSQF